MSLITFFVTNVMPASMENSMDNSLKLVLDIILGLAAFVSVAAMAAGGVSLFLPSSADAGGYKAKRIIAFGAVGLAVTMLLNIIVSIAFG